LVGNIIDVLFKVINNRFAINEYANTADYGNYGGYWNGALERADAHLALTLLIVLTPLVLAFFWYRAKLVKESGEAEVSFATPLFKVLNWIFASVASVSIISVFIYFVYTLLGGKYDTSSILQALIVIIAGGFVLYYSSSMIRFPSFDMRNIFARKFSLWAFIIGIILAFILGFIYANPKESIKVAADQVRLNDLTQNIRVVNNFLLEKGTLPLNAEEVANYKNQDYYLTYKSQDEDGKSYEYNLLSSSIRNNSNLDYNCSNSLVSQGYTREMANKNCSVNKWSGNAVYEVCAKFDTNGASLKSVSQDKASKSIYSWDHDNGRACYSVDLDANRNDFEQVLQGGSF
jgi:hypothetical protein